MKLKIQTILTGWKTTAVIVATLFSTLMWSRKIVRRTRPVFYLTDCVMVSCAFATALWIV